MGDLQRMLRKAAQVLVMARKINKEQMHNYFMSGENTSWLFFYDVKIRLDWAIILIIADIAKESVE